jgi:glycine oxidase
LPTAPDASSNPNIETGVLHNVGLRVTDAEIVGMGRHSLTLWPKWLAELPLPVFYRDSGTLLLLDRDGATEANRFERMLTAQDAQTKLLPIDGDRLKELEPAFDPRFHQALEIRARHSLTIESCLRL